MSHSLRELFGRDRELTNVAIGQLKIPTISVQQSLSNHHGASALSLRTAAERFKRPADGDGYGRGCRVEARGAGGAGRFLVALPSWAGADDAETRTVEGVLTLSRITHEDFPFAPWHTYYDWNFHVQPDPQYTYLHSHGAVPATDSTPSMQCEWDTSGLPSWAWPQDGDRLWIRGRWIYDCGHPDASGHSTEIHPPKAVASFRPSAHRLPGNDGPTRTIEAAAYFGRQGGYWQQSINDEDYEFDVPLPDQPYEGAQPAWIVLPQTGPLPVAPTVRPFPENNPTQVRVRVPMSEVAGDPDEYGFVLHCGWTDPRRTAIRNVRRVQVTIDTLFMDGDGDTWRDDWYVYVAVNRTWLVWQNLDGDRANLRTVLSLDLHVDDPIHISVCGFEADIIHNQMGKNSGLTWAEISDPSMTVAEATVLALTRLVPMIFWSFGDENDRIGRIDVAHSSRARGSFVTSSDSTGLLHRLAYTISDG